MPLASPPAFGVVAGVLLLAGYFLYRATIPKPIPGIPYVAASAMRAFGDVPDALNYHAKTSETIAFLGQKCVELNSPIVQVFMRPFSRPWVVLMDSQESQDIMARRTRKFDRSEFFGDLLRATMPHNQVSMKTTDQWRFNRRLMADTMSPQFLHNVAGPQVHAQFCTLIDLWRTKADLAQGHPFDASEDIEGGMMDAIYAAAFGSSVGTTLAQSTLISSLQKLDRLPTDPDVVAVFPQGPRPAVKDAITIIANSSEIPMTSPLGRWHHAFALRYYPTINKAVKFKDQLVREKLHAAWQKFTSADASADDIKCAADLIVEREVTLAKKQGRQPQYDSLTVQDELCGFLIAGYDTTATTIEWGVKYLTAHQGVQKKLRQSLKSVFTEAAENGKAPTAVDVAKTSTPYLDAVVEEVLRCGVSAAGTVRVATQDTEIFGHHIPKGTDVFMLVRPTRPPVPAQQCWLLLTKADLQIQGPSYTAPPLFVDEAKRSETSKQLPPEDRWTGTWDPTALDHFDPERWLVTNEKGEQSFDPQAGPMQTFGGGLRGCFGKKLARLALRIVFTLIVWNLELQPLPEALKGFEAEDKVTHRPQKVFLRLKECAA
ncbi:hypothetical protein LTR08_002779 [Meristemomyces frigidus]|nr:hypothetical protein LTR08_002779 [Meristemomyces frigidus]